MYVNKPSSLSNVGNGSIDSYHYQFTYKEMIVSKNQLKDTNSFKMMATTSEMDG